MLPPPLWFKNVLFRCLFPLICLGCGRKTCLQFMKGCIFIEEFVISRIYLLSNFPEYIKMRVMNSNPHQSKPPLINFLQWISINSSIPTQPEFQYMFWNGIIVVNELLCVCLILFIRLLMRRLLSWTLWEKNHTRIAPWSCNFSVTTLLCGLQTCR